MKKESEIDVGRECEIGGCEASAFDTAGKSSPSSAPIRVIKLRLIFVLFCTTRESIPSLETQMNIKEEKMIDKSDIKYGTVGHFSISLSLPFCFHPFFRISSAPSADNASSWQRIHQSSASEFHAFFFRWGTWCANQIGREKWKAKTFSETRSLFFRYSMILFSEHLPIGETIKVIQNRGWKDNGKSLELCNFVKVLKIT